MRVLVVGARGIPNVEGGAEKNAEMIFPLIVEKGADVHLLCHEPGTEAGEYRKVRLVKAPKIVMLGTDKLAAYTYGLFYALRFRPDVVHFQGLGSAIVLWIYKLLGVRTIVRYGSADYLVGKWGVLGRLGFRWSEWQLRLADKVIAVTPALANRLRDKGIEGNVVVIGNALDEVQSDVAMTNIDRLGLADKKFVLSVGRVTAQKDFLLLVKAFNLARERGTNLDKLIIVGNTDDKRYLDVLKPHLNDNVILTGRLPRGSFSDLLSQCTVYVNSSMHEGHSNAVMEAISYERPLIVSDIPENRDLPLKEQQFFRSGNIDDLADRLDAVANRPTQFIADRRSFHGWPDVAAATYKLYQNPLP